MSDLSRRLALRPLVSPRLILFLGTYLPGVVQLEYVDINWGNNLGSCGSGTLSQCESQCASTSGCVGFAISCEGVGCGGPSPVYSCCYKQNLGTSNIQANSGIVAIFINSNYQNQQTPFIGWDFAGNDIEAFTGTYDECIQECLDTPNCGIVEFFDYGSLTSTSTQVCNFKTISNINWRFQDGWQSYILPQTSTGGTNLDTHCLPCPQGSQR